MTWVELLWSEWSGRIALIAAALAVLGAIGVLLAWRTPRHSARARARGTTAAMLAWLGIAIAACIGVSRAGSALVVRWADPDPFPFGSSPVMERTFHGLQLQMASATLLVVVGILAVPLGAAAAARPWTTRRELGPMIVAGAAVLSIVAAVAGIGTAVLTVWAPGDGRFRMFGWEASAEPATSYAAFASALESAHGWVLAGGGLGLGLAIAAAILAARRGRSVSWPALGASAGIAIAGVLAWTATRAAAYDTRHLIPRDVVGARPEAFTSGPARILADCHDFDFGPTLVWSGPDYRLDGLHMDSEEQLVDNLRTLDRNWQILHPGRTPLRELHVFAGPAEARAARTREVLDAARAAGWTPVARGARRTVHRSATLGERRMLRACIAAWPGAQTR